MWVKICGITDEVTAAAAEAAGADAIGLVLAPSPRRITPETAARIAGAVSIDAYVLVVDADPDWVMDTASAVGAAGVQPYGWSAAAVARAARAAGLDVLRPVLVGDARPDLAGIPDDERVLTDTAGTSRGGSGQAFDWRLVVGLDRPFVLAGGLTPGNVAEAITLVGPAGVDVSSGVESRPGVKDTALISSFIESAKTA